MVTLGGSHQRPSPPATPTLLSSLLCCCSTGSKGPNSRRRGTQAGTELQTLRRAGPGCVRLGTGKKTSWDGGPACTGNSFRGRRPWHIIPPRTLAEQEGVPAAIALAQEVRSRASEDSWTCCPLELGLDPEHTGFSPRQSPSSFQQEDLRIKDQRGWPGLGQGAGPGAMWGRGAPAARARARPSPHSWGCSCWSLPPAPSC